MIIATDVVIATRWLLISLKYGYYPKQTWQNFRLSDVPYKELEMNMLLIAWITVPPEIADREIIQAYKRISNIKPKNLCFKFIRPVSLDFQTQIDAFLEKDYVVKQLHAEH